MNSIDFINQNYWTLLFVKYLLFCLINIVRSSEQKHINSYDQRRFESGKIKHLQRSIKKLPITINYTNRLKCLQEYSNDNFKAIVFSYYKLYSSQLNSSNLIKKLGIKLGELSEYLFFHYFDQILQNFKEKNIYANLPISKRSPHLIASAIIYTIIETHFDVALTKKEYSNILSINHKKFTDCVNNCIKLFFIIDEPSFYNKILHYYQLLIEMINKEFKLDLSEHAMQTVLKEKIVKFYLSLKNNVVYIPEDILQKLYPSQRNVYNILNKYGFDINQLFKQLKYEYFLPQYIALVFIYFCKDVDAIKFKKKLNYSELSKLTNYPGKKISHLIQLFRFNIEKMENHRYYHTKYYSEEHFVKDLEDLYKETERLDFLFLLKMFKLLGLPLNEFAKNVISYRNMKGEGCSARTLIYILRTKISSIGNNKYYKLKKNVKILYHQKKISDVKLHKALRLIRSTENIKTNILFHNSVKYNFTFNRNNLKQIQSPIIRSRLANHFSLINEEKYPKQLFDDKSITSGSMLYLKGTNKERLLSNKVTNLIKQLNISQKMGIQKTGFLRSFSKHANKTYTSYLNLFGVIPNHQPILNSLITKRNIIAIEIPVWANTRQGEYFSGHIDVLAYYNDMIIIGDYKPTEKEIFRSLPQINAYAYLVKQQLQLDNFEKLVCIGFSKDVVWAFKPQTLEYINKFVKFENAKRIENLKCKYQSSGVKDLAQEIDKILSLDH